MKCMKLWGITWSSVSPRSNNVEHTKGPDEILSCVCELKQSSMEWSVFLSVQYQIGYAALLKKCITMVYCIMSQ